MKFKKTEIKKTKTKQKTKQTKTQPNTRPPKNDTKSLPDIVREQSFIICLVLNDNCRGIFCNTSTEGGGYHPLPRFSLLSLRFL